MLRLVPIPVLVLVLLVLGSLPAAGPGTTATAEEATPAPGHGHAAAAPPTADSPYAGRYDPAAAIRALTPEEVAQIARGEGAGFALPAEVNGVPGPRHVLDLGHDLGLSHEQRARVQAIADEMRAAVVPAGQRYLDAERALEEAFRAGTLSEADLPGRVAEVARLEGELAAAHLLAHLKTARVLTPEQIAAYNRLRGYG
jgi:Spy/CpxP family protein refolding chaperone